MEKKHIACVLSAETLYTALISIGGGIGLGILFSKLFLLLMTKIMGYGVEFGFSVSAIGVASTAAVFCAIFFLTLLYNLGRIHLSKPVELLSSSSVGEKGAEGQMADRISRSCHSCGGLYSRFEDQKLPLRLFSCSLPP